MHLGLIYTKFLMEKKKKKIELDLFLSEKPLSNVIEKIQKISSFGCWCLHYLLQLNTNTDLGLSLTTKNTFNCRDRVFHDCVYALMVLCIPSIHFVVLKFVLGILICNTSNTSMSDFLGHQNLFRSVYMYCPQIIHGWCLVSIVCTERLRSLSVLHWNIVL